MSAIFIHELGPISAWVAAGISVISTTLGIWWPWQSRKESKLVFERDYSYGTLSPLEVGRLVVGTNFRRPMVWFLIKNNGDGTAHDIHAKAVDDFDVLFFRKGTFENGHTFILENSHPVLKPGEACIIVILPRKQEAIEKPQLSLRWTEEPTRLRRSQKQRTVAMPCQLEPKAPLPETEQSLALQWLRATAHQKQSSPLEYLKQLGIDPAGLGLHDERELL